VRAKPALLLPGKGPKLVFLEEDGMKKAMVFLLLAAFALPVFANDALVLPAGVLRIYAVPVFAWAEKQYDDNGNAQNITLLSSQDSASLFNLGFAAEYGVFDWLSAAVQWTPGWYLWSDIKTTPSVSQKFNLNGVDDLFVGAKIQILGEQGLVQNKTFRFAVASGVKVALPDVDWTQQQQNLIAGNDTTVASLAKHAFGLGARGYFDFVINEMFYVNLYSEYIYLLERKNVEIYQGPLPPITADINYGYDLTFELEPHFQYMIGDSIQLGAGLPLTYNMSPKVKINGTEQANTDTFLLSIRPNVSVFFLKTFIPIEAVLQYSLPISGKNSFVINPIDLELRAYLKF
jgi:hypothetical protein